ncbi:MAG: class I poly(R)-hydroxyalkanoic acid synthase, partial [Rhodocyclales bacterium CG17_big_fil_post_rev_8_21_14_2_50_68_7]
MASPAPEPAAARLPDPNEIAATYAEVAQRASRLLAEHMQRQVSRGVTPPADELGIAQAFMDMMAKLLANPYRLAQAQMNLVWDYFSLWQHSTLRFMGMHTSPVAEPRKGDARFRDEQWEEHFLFDFIKQSYLITARHFHNVVGNVEGLDDSTQQKVNFFTRQYVDALSPTNFVLTNPEVFRETVKTHGQNLLKGFNNLLRDIEEGNGRLRVKMTEPSAFDLGRNVAATPGKVVLRNELIELLQFAPTTKEVFRRPLLIIPPWINKYYILDLRQSNSFIKWATDQGHSVFVISWVNPDARLADKGFEDYLTEGAAAALDAVCRQTGEKEANLIGYCLGGTLLGATLAWNAAKKDKRIATATFFVSLLDFSIPGELGVFIDEQQVANLEKKMRERGYLEGAEMASTFNMLRANDLIWSFVVNNYLMGKEPFPFDLLYWNADSTRMPYRMHSFYLRNMYLKNLL